MFFVPTSSGQVVLAHPFFAFRHFLALVQATHMGCRSLEPILFLHPCFYFYPRIGNLYSLYLRDSSTCSFS
nr:hypothetical protein Q903MT_gene3453 [Picea sitchensis]